MEVLDSKATIKKFLDFFEEYKKKEIKKVIHQNLGYLKVSFFEISEFDYELGDKLLNHPQEVISLMEETLKQFQDDVHLKPIRVWLTSLPDSEKVMIRNVRSEHLGKLVLIEGIVRRKTDVRPRLTHIEYLCTNPSCTYSEEKLRIPQIEDKAVTLKACPKCKSGVELINKTLIDSQSLVLEELTQDLENASDQPKRLNILLQDDLVSPFKDSRTNPGSMVYVVGFVKEVPIPTRTGSESVHYDLIVDAIYIDLMEDDYSEIVISQEEEDQIKELSKKENVVEILTNNFAPAIYGYQKIKEAILLQQFGGKGASRGDGIKARGNIHILIIGDPGAAKSQMLKAATKIAPKSSFVSGKSASGAGLCVSPDSIILTENGEMHKIQDLVEKGFANKQEKYNNWIWKRDNIKQFKIQSLSNKLKLQLKYPKTLWKLKAPEFVNEITLSSGKKIELTGNTELLSLKQGELKWIKSDDLNLNDYISTPRILSAGNTSELYILDLIKSDPHLHNLEDFIKEINEELVKKYGNLREAAKKFEIHENNLYSKWLRKDLASLPKLSLIKKICEDLNLNYKEKINEVSLYNGKNHKLPTFVDEDILYLAGLIAGDGDFRQILNTKTYSIRFSNSDEGLHLIFRQILKEKFALNYDISKDIKRVLSTRTHSKLLGEILLGLGIPISPKSHKLKFNNLMLNFENRLLTNFIAGLIDSDGSIFIREKEGSSSISYYTCSEDFIRTMQSILLRFKINSTIRKRSPTLGKIVGKYDRWCLEIRGSNNFQHFYQNFSLRSEKKKSLLKKLVELNLTSNSNVDIVPGVGLKLKTILLKHNINLKEVGWRSNFSFSGLNNCLKNLENIEDVELDEIRKIANSDIFFEKIVKIKRKKPKYEYVYDLTVSSSHNFVVNGVLVHNTATVMKDELTKGWALEAGAMVLASGGLCAIDELDKMSDEDTSSMHEALEQQCYHYDFELTFADGSTKKIGEYVEELFVQNKGKIIQGVNCEILDIKTNKLLTTDFNKINTIIPQRISRHIPPKVYYKISYSNGRSISVTPEHPVFVYRNNRIEEISAALVKKGMIVPAPRELPIKGVKQKLDIIKLNHPNNKKIYFPDQLDEKLAKLLGYIASEGHLYYNIKTRYAEIGVSNCDRDVINDCEYLFKDIFKTQININEQKALNRKKATKDLLTVRCSSIPLYKYFEKNFGELVFKAPLKRVPQLIKKSNHEVISYFLQGFFAGDGFIDSNRCGFVSASYNLMKDLQDLLLRFKINSYISTERRGLKKYYKVVVSSQSSLELFLQYVVKNDKRKERIENLLQRSKNRKNSRDIVPFEFLIPFNSFLKQLKISDGYFTNNIKRKQNSHRDVVLKYIQKAKDKLKETKNESLARQLKDFEDFLLSYIKYIRVTDVEVIKDKTQKWVYDVTVLPNKTFISEGLVLHNTISIAKANIRATLRCETTVLGAANPLNGRFDPYGDIAKQINFPPALMSRFDLIFILRDIPDKKRDDLIANHILQVHKDVSKTIADLPSDFMKKYVAYTKRINPVLTHEAIAKIKEFYVAMRNAGNDDEAKQAKSVPITARQLEAIVRLAEAYAKVRLSQHVTPQYAQEAIDLLKYCLEKIGIDPRTGELDIDRITTGVTTSTRNMYTIVTKIIDKLEQENPEIRYDDIVAEAEANKIELNDLEKTLDKLKKDAYIYEPKKNLYKKL